MTVVPFDPGYRPDPDRQDTEAELRAARARIEMLERTLTLTLRQNAAFFERAQRAEELLDRLTLRAAGGDGR